MFATRRSGSRASIRRTSRSSGGSRGSLIARRERRNLVAEDRLEHLRGVAAGEWRRAVEQLVEHDAEREDVGAAIDFAARGLLGGGIGQCADKAGEAIRQLGRSGLVARAAASDSHAVARRRSRAP